jgi:hypothetical protein
MGGYNPHTKTENSEKATNVTIWEAKRRQMSLWNTTNVVEFEKKRSKILLKRRQMSSRVHDMKQRYSSLEIAKAAYCRESTVKKAIERGLSDDLEELMGWIFIQRIKQDGINGLERLIGRGAIKSGTELAEEKEECGYDYE